MGLIEVVYSLGRSTSRSKLLHDHVRISLTLKVWSVLQAIVKCCHTACQIAACAEIAGTGFRDRSLLLVIRYVDLVA